MAKSTRSADQLPELLERVETKALDGYGRMTFAARALGKSKDSLHVAVASGVVAVPLDEIEAIRPIPGRSPTEIYVDVSNGDRITHLRQVPDLVHGDRPVWPGTVPDWPPVWPGPRGGVPHTGDSDASSSTGGCDGIDTTCASGGVADATDDYRQSCWHDTD